MTSWQADCIIDEALKALPLVAICLQKATPWPKGEFSHFGHEPVVGKAAWQPMKPMSFLVRTVCVAHHCGLLCHNTSYQTPLAP